jgi:hypothetical protein
LRGSFAQAIYEVLGLSGSLASNTYLAIDIFWTAKFLDAINGKSTSQSPLAVIGFDLPPLSEIPAKQTLLYTS